MEARSRFPPTPVYLTRWTIFEKQETGDIEMQTSVQSAVPGNIFHAQTVEPLAVLRDLFELLEDYAPIWYTEELHIRAAAALGEMEPALS